MFYRFCILGYSFLSWSITRPAMTSSARMDWTQISWTNNMVTSSPRICGRQSLWELFGPGIRSEHAELKNHQEYLSLATPSNPNPSESQQSFIFSVVSHNRKGSVEKYLQWGNWTIRHWWSYPYIYRSVLCIIPCNESARADRGKAENIYTEWHFQDNCNDHGEQQSCVENEGKGELW